MPSKRQPAKQRRAAENRAKRAAQSARTEHAHLEKPAPAASSGSGKSAYSRPAAARQAVGRADSSLAQFFGFGGGRPEVGARACLFALMFGLASLLISPFLPVVPVDDRGESVPQSFQGLFLDARTRLSGHAVKTELTSSIDAFGPVSLLYSIVPFLVVVVAVIMFRRTGRSTPLTVGMIGMAVVVLFGGQLFFLPSMIALAVASFQIRKVEMAGRMAEKAGAPAEPAADEDEYEDEDDEEYEEYDDEEDAEYDEYEDDVEYEDVEDGEEDEFEDVVIDQVDESDAEEEPKPR